MDRIRVKEDFSYGIFGFQKGITFWGHWTYVSGFRKGPNGEAVELPLVVIGNEFVGPYLLPKEYFELVS